MNGNVKGVNALLIPTFWPYFYFDPYFLILPHFAPKVKKQSHFSLYHHLINGNCLLGKRSALLAQYMLM